MSSPTPADSEIERLLELAAQAIKIDQSVKEDARSAMRSALYESTETGLSTTTSDDEVGGEIGEAEIVRITDGPGGGSRWRLAVLGAAAAALVVAVWVSLGDSRELDVISPPSSTIASTTIASTTIVPPSSSVTSAPDPIADDADEAAAAEAIGLQFMRARAEYDGETVRSLMAPNASFNNLEFAQTVDQVPLQSDWERAVAWQYLEASCNANSPDFVVCSYTIQAPLNEQLGKGPYAGNNFGLTIADGRIQVVNHNLIVFDFYTDTEAQFYAWVRENHPGDLELMLEGDRLMGGDFPTFPNLNPESIRLWETHTAEYLATLG